MYWFLFVIPLFGVVIPVRFDEKVQNCIWVIVLIITTLLIGTRYEVGGDWQGLFDLSSYYVGKGLHVAFDHESVAYGLLNWVSAKCGLGIYGVNTVCGAILVTGLAVFCRRQPIPWLAWLIATPYLLVVVGMGYTRQSAALGFLLLGLACLEDKRIWRYFLLLAIGATFHKTVLLMVPLGILVWRQNIWLRLALIVIGSISLLWIGNNYRELVFSNAAEPNEIFRLWYKYVEHDQWSSIGASYRVWMNAIPAVLFLLFLKKWKRYFDNSSLWVAMAIASIVSVFFVGYFSTPIDRINIYLAPIQLYFWSRAPLLTSDRLTRTLMILITIGAYGFLLLFWLQLAKNSGNWIPYRSIFLL